MLHLIEGDCITELKKLPSHSVDLICTDPPYGNDQTYGLDKRTIVGDEHPLIGLLALAESYRVLRRNRCCFFFLDARHLSFVDMFVRRYTEYRVRAYCVWDKKHMGLGFGIRPRHEMILALEKGKPLYASGGFANVIDCARPTTRQPHPHQKPVDLMAALIAHATAPGDVVLDPFMGSGSTGVAATQLGRGFIGIECERRYIELARERIAAAGRAPEPATCAATAL